MSRSLLQHETKTDGECGSREEAARTGGRTERVEDNPLKTLLEEAERERERRREAETAARPQPYTHD